MRVGHGFDAHRFSDDSSRPLWLGLVKIGDERGLDGHSDADVATHALCDALLGAATLGDLGRHFPDGDANWRGVASAELLLRVLSMVRDNGFVVESADVTIVAQQPRLSPYFEAMGGALTAALGVPTAVKATTTDGLGAVGRGEGIAASAVVLLRDAS